MMRSPGIASIRRRWSGGQTVSGSSVQQSSGWIGHQSGCFIASSYTAAMSPRLFAMRNCSYAPSSARSSACFAGDSNASGLKSADLMPAIRSSRTVAYSACAIVG